MAYTLQDDLEAEAITLDADAASMEAMLKENLSGTELNAAIRSMVQPRRTAAQALRNAITSLKAARLAPRVGYSVTR